MATAPQVLLFDVNGTLSDMGAMATRFGQVGASGELAAPWFAQVLRDGFALAVTGDVRSFADIAVDLLVPMLAGQPLDRPVDDAAAHVVAGFATLPLHPDVVPGVQALRDAGHRLATLSNGSVDVAAALLGAAGIAGAFAELLSVESATTPWKPAPAAYLSAAEVLDVRLDEIVLVAVHPWDVHGAVAAGASAVWLNRDGATWPAHFSPPRLEVASLAELPAALELAP